MELASYSYDGLRSRTIAFNKAFRLFSRALADGGTLRGLTCIQWDVSSGCQAPVTIELVGRRERFVLKRHEVAPVWHDQTTWESVSVIMETKCRKCETCARAKRQLWFSRAKDEFRVAPRTWFATLTYHPEVVFQRTLAAEINTRRKGLDWDGLEPGTKFKVLTSNAGRGNPPLMGDDVTLAFKRMRKSASGPLRFFLVAEPHASGVPHFHALIHEVSMHAITHAKLTACWTLGFSKFKLADPECVGYVSAYISKDLTARVRASLGYGQMAHYMVSSSPKCNGSETEM